MPLPTTEVTNSLNPMSFTENIHGNIVMNRLRLQKETGRFCDVILVVRDRQFNAHRNILAGCSPYFDSILKMNKVVKEQVTVNCQNPQVFELLINYMYSGNVVIDRGSVMELLKLSNNFLVTKLKNYCAEYLDRYLDAANCLTVKELASKYNMPGLLKNTCEYLESNINRCLLESDDLLGYSLEQVKSLMTNSNYCYMITSDVHLRLVARWIGRSVTDRESFFKELLSEIPLKEIARETFEHLLDFDTLFDFSETARFTLLQAMYGNSIPLLKYETQYRALSIKHGIDVTPFLENIVYLNADPMNAVRMPETPIDCIPVVMPIEDMHTGEGVEQPPIMGGPTTKEAKIMNTENGVQVDRPALKLTLKLPLMNRKSRLLGKQHRLYRKSVTTANQTLVTLLNKRRGRPPKFRARVRAGFDSPLYPDCGIDLEGGNGALVVDEGGQVELSFHCPNCTYTAHSQSRITAHVTRAHARNVIFVCVVCQFECNWNREYYTHMKTHFPGPPFRCTICSYTTDRIQMLLTHRLKHYDDRPYRCIHCDYRCRTKTNLFVHVRNHAGEKPFSCTECGRGFAIKSTLDQHLATHSDTRPFQCDQCNFSTKYQSHLISHKRIHTGDVFHCQFSDCSYSSPKKSQLAAHLRTHLAVRSHTCKICNRSFIEKSHLVRHERIHLAEKPFKCAVEHCDYASSRRDKLKEHIQKHHGATASSKQHRRRHRRAKQLAQLAAQVKQQRLGETTIDPAAVFKPIVPPYFDIPARPNSAAFPTMFSMPGGNPSPALSLNFHLGGYDTPLVGPGKDVLLGGQVVPTPTDSLVTPDPTGVTRSPAGSLQSDPFPNNLATPSADLQRPVSLPPLGGQTFVSQWSQNADFSPFASASFEL